jgi:hypothetical protein
MPVAQTFRNNEVERMAESFPFGVPENSLRGRIPQEYGTVGSCRDDGIAGCVYKSLKVE